MFSALFLDVTTLSRVYSIALQQPHNSPLLKVGSLPFSCPLVPPRWHKKYQTSYFGVRQSLLLLANFLFSHGTPNHSLTRCEHPCNIRSLLLLRSCQKLRETKVTNWQVRLRTQSAERWAFFCCAGADFMSVLPNYCPGWGRGHLQHIFDLQLQNESRTNSVC